MEPTTPDLPQAHAAGATTVGGKPFGRILLCITEDWFALSHFVPLIGILTCLADRVLVVTRSSGRLAEIEALGVETHDLDYHRSSLDPAREIRTARRLARIIRAFSPDAMHLVAMKPIVLGSLAVRVAPVEHVIVHLTGLGFLGIVDTPRVRVVRWLVLKQISATLRRRGNWLFAENTEDVAYLAAHGVPVAGRTSVLGGAGIDPARFPFVPERPGRPIRAAYVGRMIRPKGIDVLLDASRLLSERGVPVAIDLYGTADSGNPEAIPAAVLEAWSGAGHGRWHGPTTDVAGVWRRSHVFVLPALSREGLPRALLEAAASGRPAIVTDVPGCRSFVRDGVEGLIVPPGDARALAAAIERLTQDHALRQRLGEAARRRVLDGYTTADVTTGLAAGYRALAVQGGTARRNSETGS